MVDVLMRRAVIATALVLLAGCGGGGGGSSPAVPTTPKQPSTVQKSIKIIVPGYNPAKSLKSQYVSRNTQGIGVSYGASPFTFPAITTPNSAFDVSLGGGQCTVTNATTGARTCTLTIPAPVGTDDFQVVAWDTVPVTGHFTSGNVLSTVSLLSQTVASGVNTPLNLTLNGIVTSVNTSVSPQSLPATVANSAPQTATVSVNALDADGDVIMGSGLWIDGNGSALTISVTPSSPPNGGPILIAPTSPMGVNPATPTITASYTGGSTWGTTFVPTVAGATLPITTSSSTLNITPTVTLFPVPTASSQPWRITSATDGNLYFTESSAGQIGQINTSGTVTAEISSSPGVPGNQVAGITQSTDGNLWWVTYNVQVDEVSPSSFNNASVNVMDSVNPGGQQQDIVDGHDGFMYFTEPGAGDIEKVTKTQFGATGFFSGSGLNTPVGIVYGPDGNLWFADSTAGAIRDINISGQSLGAANPASGFPQYVAVGPDGNIWYTASNGHYVGYYTTGGVASAAYATPVTLGAINGIAAGSDGALWFAGRGSPGNGGIGRVTTSGIVTVFFAGLGAADDPFGMTQGPDGNMWFTEPLANKIGRLIY